MLTNSFRLNGGYTSVEKKQRFVLKVDHTEFHDGSFQTVQWTNQEKTDTVTARYSVSV